MKKLEIGNWKLEIGKGFTLMEMLVAVGLFTAVAITIISVLFASFRAGKKSEVIIAVKQDGNLALSRMENSIRFAKSLDDPLVCVPEEGEDYVEQDRVTITSFDGGQTTYSCPGVATETISSNSAALLDTNTVTVDACSFICFQTTTYDPPTITIKFILVPAESTDFAETKTSISFQSAVTMRNFNR